VRALPNVATSLRLPRPQLTCPLPTKDRGTLRTVLDTRTYMLSLASMRELRGQWQRACALMLAESDVAELTRAIELALFFDAKLDVTAMA
jgi:hypothetical protein